MFNITANANKIQVILWCLTWYDVLQPEAKKAMEWLVKRFHDIILVLSDSKPLFTRQKEKYKTKKESISTI